MQAKTVATAAGIVVSAATLSLLFSTPAQAESRSEYIAMQCYGLNPNILDIPFYGGATVTTDSPWPGQFSIGSDSKSLFPYTTDTTVTVTELATNRTQTFQRHWTHGLGDDSGYQITGLTGHGQIRVTITATNHGLIPDLPGPTCSGVATV
ncbi:hypothetical protein [Jongsikchunia kroppenstedtii]|uniref:hypothetical protein n=1 Tax=Jongsikchunia kroppenstedtii TaxID=1121721 RepID=UPI00036C460B|nr:hypothetical protein [Jongsikchunia kroppenstedtii]